MDQPERLIVQKMVFGLRYKLGGAILEGGIPFNRAHGIHVFEYPGRDKKFNEVFNQEMINNTSIFINRVLDSYNGFEHFKSLVDVGGGHGITINKITAKYPAIKGINLDLPHVIQHAPAYARVQHIGGNMFVSVPQADAVLVKFILHDWDDAHCVELLKKCYASVPDDGKVIVVEAVLPVIPNTISSVKQSCQVDLIMMMNTTGGKERSEHEFIALAIAARFIGIEKKCFVCDLWVMEFYK